MNFYYSDLPPSGNQLLLPADESAHCLRVMRCRKGDSILVVDGQGTLYHTVLVSEEMAGCSLRIIRTEKNYNQNNYWLHIALAPVKSMERFEWFIEKAVETGIDEITPIVCMRSERRKLNPERIRKIMISAMKQSGKAFLPVLHPAADFSEFIKRPVSGAKWLCHAGKESSSMAALKFPQPASLFLIGPEGDFTSGEIQAATENNFKLLSLGSQRLRTETAGVYICSVMHALHQMNR